MKISVIVAVYNPGEHINDLLRSLETQSMPADEFEVIFVDDDSTDGTRERLQELAAQNANFMVLHNSPNSGWPGRPRNIGIDAASGEYVLFADNDDWLPDSALENLWQFAVENDSDVVVAKEVGQGHTIPWRMFERTVPRATIEVDPLLRLLTPHKLFRRDLLLKHGIRFPEGRVRLEDHLFVVKSYFAADTISIYSDHVCYYWVSRNKKNASSQSVDPFEYYGRDLANVLDVVDAHVPPGDLRNQLYSQWYRLKMVRRLGTRGFLKAPPDYQVAMFNAIRQLVLERFPAAVDEYLDPTDRLRAAMVRSGHLDRMLELSRWDLGIKATAELTELRWNDDDCLRISVKAAFINEDGSLVQFSEENGRLRRILPSELVEGVPEDALDFTGAVEQGTVAIVLKDRATQELYTVPIEGGLELRRDGTTCGVGASVTATIDPATVAYGQPLPKVSDPVLRLTFGGWGSERRVPFDADVAAPAAELAHRVGNWIFTAYPTEGYGKLSIRRSKVPAQAAPPAGADTSKQRSVKSRAMRRLKTVGRQASTG